MADDNKNISVTIMIVEAGVIANCITPTDQGKALVNKVFDDASQAWTAEQSHFDLVLNPLEAGMIIDGLSRSQGSVLGDLQTRIGNAVNALLSRLGIEPLGGNAAGGVPGGPSPFDNPSSEGGDEGGTGSEGTDPLGTGTTDSTGTDSTGSDQGDGTGSSPSQDAPTESTPTEEVPAKTDEDNGLV